MTGGAVVDVVDGQALQITSDHDGDVDLSLVIPTFNEAGNIADLVRRLHALLDGAGVSHELIVVDDDSPDRTWEVAGALVGEVPTLRVLRRTGETGLATAVVCGWAHARSRVLGVIDGDGQHPPEVLPELLGVLDESTDVAIASR
ncbi:MAG: glycosyltransferase, partial [Acidimicrobiales bacterium]|nr:glycosyltransferase [Acidimicrobiales bacterium]